MAETEATEAVGDAERMKFFTDAVVAIAMTLLILPLLESVGEAVREHEDTAGYLHANSDQLLAFVLSFVIVGRFWLGHERLFDHVGRWTGPLMLLNQLWMLSIVFLPVATALVGSMETDAAQVTLYIGTMLASGVLMTAMQALVRRTPSIWAHDHGPPAERLTSSLVFLGLLAVALVIALVVSSVGYLALLVLLLSGPLDAVVSRFSRAHGG